MPPNQKNSLVSRRSPLRTVISISETHWATEIAPYSPEVLGRMPNKLFVVAGENYAIFDTEELSVRCGSARGLSACGASMARPGLPTPIVVRSLLWSLTAPCGSASAVLASRASMARHGRALPPGTLRYSITTTLFDRCGTRWCPVGRFPRSRLLTFRWGDVDHLHHRWRPAKQRRQLHRAPGVVACVSCQRRRRRSDMTCRDVGAASKLALDG